MSRFVTKRGGAGLTTPLPIYVTRKTAHGETAELSLSLWMVLLALFLVWANVVIWGVIGLVTAVGAVL